jgi:histidinol dehydrogenase
MIEIIKADGTAEKKRIEAMRARSAEVGAEVNRAAAEIMDAVRLKGFEAVREYSLRFDKAEPREISRGELEEAYNTCPAELKKALELAAERIRDYNEKLLTRSAEWKSPDGGTVGRVVRGLTRVGIYVPGGTAAYPSSVLMNAVPARVAGVEEILMVTPPTENLNKAVLAAAKIAGVDRVFAVGGAQAVAALTYGAGFIPKADKLVGPATPMWPPPSAWPTGSWTSTWWRGPPRCWSSPTSAPIPGLWPPTS